MPTVRTHSYWITIEEYERNPGKYAPKQENGVSTRIHLYFL